MKQQQNNQQHQILPQNKNQKIFDYLLKTKTCINLDCVKVCPMDKQLWAFAFYQQHPQFCGGIQIITTNIILDKAQTQFKFGGGPSYLEMGPLMHIEWLDTSNHIKNLKQYYIIAASRCDQAIVIKYTVQSKQIKQIKRIQLGKSIFCLYCDWQIIKQCKPQQILKTNNIQTIAAVSTSQSTVYTFQICIDISVIEITNQDQIKIVQITQYNKHEYAVWACKVNSMENGRLLLVAGDQVDCLYLYDLKQKKLLAKNKTAHTQGICQIIWKNQNTLLTGSFDGSFAEICINNFSSTLKRIQLGGTIWRIIPLYQNQPKLSQELLICNSSQKKFQIVNYTSNQVTWDSKQQHTSLAYAADFNGKFIISVSFYDQQIRVWQIKSQ